MSKHWLLVLFGWVLVTLAVHQIAPNWASLVQDGESAYLPSWMSSVRGAKLLKRAFPDINAKSEVVVVVARPGGALRQADYAAADRLVQKLTPANEPSSPVTSVWSYATPILGPELISPVGRFGQATLILLNLRTEMAAIENMGFIYHLRQTLDATQSVADYPAGLKLGLTGSPAISADMLLAAEESIRNTEWTTIVLVVLILVAVYRAPGLVLVPLLTILATWVLSIDLLALLAEWSRQVEWFDFKLFQTSKIFIVVILFGAATDYCLFLISRYLEGLRQKLSPGQALETALVRVGGAITASAMATILGLSSMVFAEFGRFRYGGLTIALALAVALVACLTLAPSLLRAGGRAAFWPFRVDGRPPPNNPRRNPVIDRVWERIGHAIVTRPGRIFLASLLITAWPAYVGLSVPVTFDLLAELNPRQFSIYGTNLLTRYFPTGQTGPITILARRSTPVFETKEGKAQVSQLTRELYQFNYHDSSGKQTRPILRVRSLTNPLGGRPGVLNPFSTLGRRNMAALDNPQIVATYLSKAPGYEGQVTRFDLVAQDDPFSLESVRLLDHIEDRLTSMARDPASAWHGTEFAFVGTTAEIRDMAAVNKSDFLRIAVLTCVVVLAVLIVLLRRLLVSLFLILTVLWGYLVTMGVTKLVFLGLYGTAFDGVTWRLPLFLFVILVAVGEDYNIYLMARVVEEQKRRGSLEGLRVALVRTGGIITSCGVIMAGTFASMMTGRLREMHELGFALAFGVLLDTFVIRTIVVPSFLALLARRFPQKGEPAPSGDRSASSYAEEPVPVLEDG